MRTREGIPSLMVEAAVFDQSDEKGGLSGWGGSLSRCTGAHLRYGPIGVPANSTVILDKSLDWRDRICEIKALADVADLRPGVGTGLDSNITMFGADVDKYELNCVFYTALGWDQATSRATLQLSNQNFVPFYSTLSRITDLKVSLFADSNTGFLSIKSTQTVLVGGALWIMASEQTGQRSAVP